MVRTSLLWIATMVFGLVARDIIGEIPLPINLKSGLMVLAGTLIGGLLPIPVSACKDFFYHVFVCLKRHPLNLNGLIAQIAALARLQRVTNIRELSMRVKALENPFLRRGIQQVLDNRDRRQVETSVEWPLPC